ncbi:zeta toxin family protein [Blastopirellula marina]|uniref:Zeta toxin domain-containing protein n=1 Tax=Blastopirellula marina TaxID=124 RepID=A0A2S8GLF8_9BACT|nr:hypothetical protein C5Y93_15050 [Blastopirellula marina]
MLQRIDELTGQRANFSFESTLSGRGYLRRLREMKLAGYEVHLFFLWLPNVEMAIARVANRVRQGGHNIPEADIRRRYNSGMKRFLNDFAPEADGWQLYDASSIPPQLIAEKATAEVTLYDAQRWQQVNQSAREGT